MSDQLPPSQNPNPPDNPQNTGILTKTLGDIVKNNPQAQKLIMQAMGINQQQLQDMISQASSNPMMNMPISDMFKNGMIQQAAQARGMQVSPDQFQQMLHQIDTQTMPSQTPQAMQTAAPVVIPVGVAKAAQQEQPAQKSFFQKLKGLFK